MKEDDKNKIIDLYKNGVKPINIALSEQYSILDIFLVLEEADRLNIIKLKSQPPYLSKRDKKIVQMWNSMRYTYQLIADEIGGISRERVRQILSKAKKKGFQVKDVLTVSKIRSEANKSNRLTELDDSIKKDIIDSYHSGQSFDEILKTLDPKTSYDLNLIRIFIEHLKTNKLVSYKQHIFSRIKLSRDNPDAVTVYRESVIIKMRKDNAPLQDIANKLGISKIRLTQIIRRMKNKGINVPNSRVSGNTLSEMEILRRVDLIDVYLDDHVSINKIAELLEMSPQHISMLIYTHLVQK